MANDGVRFQDRIRLPEHHRRANSGALPGVVRAVRPDHPEPEPAEGLPREPAAGRRSMLGAGEQKRHVLRRPRGPGPAAGVRHAHLADYHPE